MDLAGYVGHAIYFHGSVVVGSAEPAPLLGAIPTWFNVAGLVASGLLGGLILDLGFLDFGRKQTVSLPTAQNIEAELLPASSPDPGGAYCTDTPPRRQPLAVEPVILPRRYAFRCRLYFVDFYACNCPANLITTITRCRRSRGSHDFERVEGFPTRPHLLRSVKYKVNHDPSHAAIKPKDEGHR